MDLDWSAVTKLYDVFICHASEDKDDFVRPLAEALRSHRLEVWYDEFALDVGDSLREAIDRGLATSRYGIVVLSPRLRPIDFTGKNLKLRFVSLWQGSDCRWQRSALRRLCRVAPSDLRQLYGRRTQLRVRQCPQRSLFPSLFNGFECLIWLLCDESRWMPEELRETLKRGFRERVSWWLNEFSDSTNAVRAAIYDRPRSKFSCTRTLRTVLGGSCVKALQELGIEEDADNVV